LYDEVVAQGGDIPGAEGLFGTVGGGRMLDVVGTFVGAVSKSRGICFPFCTL
jgi:hypothetical protein